MPWHGKTTQVFLDAVDLSPFLTSAELAVDLDTSDGSTFGTTWKSAVVGEFGAKFDSQGFYDPTNLKFAPNVLTTSGSILTFGPAGMTSVGQGARLMQVVNTSYANTSPVGGIVAFKWSATTDAPVGYGWILHPLAKDTNTTTGASRDDTAATTTGWTAHLHVTAVDAGSWVIKIQDSADNSAWADVTSGAFTAATTATSQRLTGASGATLRRYVRYIATRTGGSAGDGITFALAYARNN